MAFEPAGRIALALWELSENHGGSVAFCQIEENPCLDGAGFLTLNERLRVARQRAGFESAAKAAEALGVQYSTYAGHENGSSGFPAKRGELYARRFKVRFEWLMNGSGPMADAELAQFSEFFALLVNARPEAVNAALTTLRLGQKKPNQE